MPTTAPTRTHVSVELDGDMARDLFSGAKLVAGFASRDDARAVLCAVRIDSDGKRVRLEATDSFRLARIDLATTMPVFDVRVDARWLVANLPKGRIGIADHYVVTITDDRFEVADRTMDSTASIKLTGGEWADTDALIGGLDDAPDDGDFERAFNPKFLSTVLTAAHKFTNGSSPVRVRLLDPLKPCRFDVVSATGTLTILLMPVRVS